jgi:hypothetical protein
MPDRSVGRGQTKCNPWSSSLGVGRGANDPTLEIFTVTKRHGGGQDALRVVAPVKKKNK